jgi:Protein of unknown function (DUF4058)
MTMPLHDWTDRPGWEGMRQLWITELLRWVKPRLPAPYRAFIGSAPLVAIGGPPPLRWPWDADRVQSPTEAQPHGTGEPSEQASSIEPDEEIAVAPIDEDAIALFVEREGRLVAAVEVISPRNKDRLVPRNAYLARNVSYLMDGVHATLIDVHRRPPSFSFADAIARDLDLSQPPMPAPCAVCYRVGRPAAAGGRMLAIWRRPLVIGQPLPAIVLPVTKKLAVFIDLEHTYGAAALDAYVL